MRVYVENTTMASSIKNDLFARVYMLGKSIESISPLVAEVKRIKIDLHICVCVCVYISVRP